MAQVSKRIFHTSPNVLLRKIKSKTGPVTKWQKRPLPRRLDPKISSDPQYEDPNYFEKAAANLSIGPDYIEQLGKLWHEKLSTERDVYFKRDDHLTEHDSRYWLPDIHPMSPKVGYEKVEALQNAPISVKKIFSVGYGERHDLTAMWKSRLKESVGLSPADNSSLESKIAKSTALIRSWTMLIDDIARQTEKKPRWLINMLRLQIDHRRRCLKMLRDRNVESFERILNELKISYHVPPEPEDVPQRSREGWIIDQIKRRVETEKEIKLRDYHKKLVKEREAYQQMKTEKLAALEEEEKQLKQQLAALTTESGEILTVAGKYQGHTIDSLLENFYHRNYYSSEWYPSD